MRLSTFVFLIIFHINGLNAQEVQNSPLSQMTSPDVVNSGDSQSESTESTRLYFVEGERIVNNLSGSLSGMVQFAQTHTIYPNGNSAKELPRLVSDRKTLLIFIPLVENLNEIKVIVRTASGGIIGESFLKRPEEQPQSDKPLSATGPDVQYAEQAWTTLLPWNWIKPGLNINFVAKKADQQEEVTGNLSSIEVGAPNELIIQSIRLGLLAPHKNIKAIDLENDPLLAHDYFQKIPVSRLTVGNYLPIQFDKIVLSDGTVYTDASTDTGTGHNGDLKEIAGHLFSRGINHANYGFNSSKSDWHFIKTHSNFVTINRSVGHYANGIVSHGYLGGYGVGYLESIIGNEFSHEIGHVFGLGHYIGGPQYDVHSQNSGWGWDSIRNKFIANFFWNNRGGDRSLFANTYSFNTDTMSDGVASSPISFYTHHTGYTQKRIQSYLEELPVFSSQSSTGYRIWNESDGTMLDSVRDNMRVPLNHGVDVVTLVGYYDPHNKLPSYIYPALYGSYGNVYRESDETSPCFMKVTFEDETQKNYKLDHIRQNDKMNRLHVNLPAKSLPKKAEVFCSSSFSGLKFQIRNGRFAHINLPDVDVPENAIIQINRTSDWVPNVLVDNQVIKRLDQGDTTFQFDGSQWVEIDPDGLILYLVSKNVVNNENVTSQSVKDELDKLNFEMRDSSLALTELDIARPDAVPAPPITVGKDHVSEERILPILSRGHQSSYDTFRFECVDRTNHEFVNKFSYRIILSANASGFEGVPVYKAWSWPAVMAKKINNLHIPGIKAGVKDENGNISPVASVYRNKIWISDVTKQCRLYISSDHITNGLRIKIRNGGFGHVTLPRENIYQGSIVQVDRTSSYNPTLKIEGSDLIHKLEMGLTTFRYDHDGWYRVRDDIISSFSDYLVINNVDVTSETIRDELNKLNQGTAPSPLKKIGLKFIITRKLSPGASIHLPLDGVYEGAVVEIRKNKSQFVNPEVFLGDTSFPLTSNRTVLQFQNNQWVKVKGSVAKSFNLKNIKLNLIQNVSSEFIKDVLNLDL